MGMKLKKIHFSRHCYNIKEEAGEKNKINVSSDVLKMISNNIYWKKYFGHWV
jgi:hypothetical protein